MNSIIYLSLFALLACSVYGRAIDEPDNTISSDTAFVEINEWVKVKPIKIRPHVGNTVELECDVIGSPPPSIHWVRGDKSVDNVSILDFISVILIRRFSLFCCCYCCISMIITTFPNFTLFFYFTNIVGL